MNYLCSLKRLMNPYLVVKGGSQIHLFGTVKGLWDFISNS